MWLAEQIGTLGIFAVIVAWEHVMLLIKYVMQTTISPLPRCVRDELKREKHRLEQQRYSTMTSRRGQYQRAKSNLSIATAASFKSPEGKKKVDDQHLMMTPEHGLLRTIPSAEEEASQLFSC
jgi:hypothetical protein